jgi:uncharacterized protein YodC (DUF2158 family)
MVSTMILLGDWVKLKSGGPPMLVVDMIAGM